MSHINCEDHETNDASVLLDADGDKIYCQAEWCEAEATNCVAVSVDGAHDEFRHYCEACTEVYMVGVQHGRYHEAAAHGVKPGRDDSQTKPKKPRRK